MSLLVESTIKMSLILLLAFVATTLLRKRSAAVRHWVLAAAILCAAATPALLWIIPAWHLPARMSQRVEPVVRLVEPDKAAGKLAPIAAPIEGHRSQRVTAAHLLLSIWLAGAGLSLFVLLGGLARLRWLASQGQQVLHGPWSQLADDIALRYSLTRRVLLLQGSQPTLLATWGLMRPKIIFPAAAREWTEDRMRIVLSHELAHIQRRDWLTQMIAEVLRSVYWFNPFLRLACTRLRRESEHACDDAVLRLGVDASTYARQLVDLARALNPPYTVALGIARPSSLEKRIGAILNATLSRTPISRTARLVIVSMLLGVAFAVAGLRGSAQTVPVFSGFVFDQTGAGVRDVTLMLSKASSEPALRPASNRPLSLRFTKASVFDVINFPMKAAGIEVRYTTDVNDRAITLQLDGVTIQQALDQIMAMSQLSYKVMNDRSILVFRDPGNVLHETHTDAAGYYQFGELPPGNYFLQSRVPGFKVFQDSFVLPADQSVRRDITLQLGSVAETYTLDESAASQLGESKDAGVVQKQLERFRAERVQPPIMIRRTALQYPQNLRGGSRVSRVIVEGRIGVDGFLTGLRVLPDVDPIVEKVVLDGVRQWQWEPTRLNGIPVEVPISVTIDFVPSR